MNALAQWGPVAVIVGGYRLGIFFQNRRIDDLKDSMNKRFDDMNSSVNKRFDDTNSSVNKRFDDLRDLLKSEVKRLDDRLGRLEAPIIHQK